MSRAPGPTGRTGTGLPSVRIRVRVEVERLPEAAVLHLAGTLELVGVPAVRSGMVAALEHAPRVIVADLANVVGIDRAGAVLLAAMTRQARRLGTSLRIAAVPDQVRQVLRDRRVEESLLIDEDVDQALRQGR